MTYVPALNPDEIEDLTEIVGDWLGSNDWEDMLRDAEMGAEEAADFIAQYVRIGKLYYLFTGKDFLCGHGKISNYAEGRGNLVNI